MNDAYTKLTGLILRSEPSGDSSVLLTVLTHENGLIRIKAKGAKRRGSKLSAYTQPLVYADLTVFDYRGWYMLNEAEARSFFTPLRSDLRKLTIAAYFAEVAERLSEHDRSDSAPLRLTLSALHQLCGNTRSIETIKAIFEWRAAVLAGYAPQAELCGVCAAVPSQPVLYVSDGIVCCSRCRTPDARDAVFHLDNGSRKAIRHIVSCPDNRLFSFETDAEVWRAAGELYLQTQLSHGFESLVYYNGLRKN
jgi:DNA repair protein RecO (recombination protein O)